MVEGEVKDWCRIAAKLPGRTNKDCRKRWHNSVAGGLKKGQWARSEDIQLSKGVHKFGQRWTLVAEVVGSRSADQCAKRWQQSLDPELDRSEWRESEDKVLIQAVQELGRHWKDIQHLHFPGRSKNCIKNRYTVLLRRYQNQPTSSSQPSLSSPGLIARSETSSTYGEDDSDTQSYSGTYAFDGSMSLRNSPAPLPSPGELDMWTKPFPDWDAPEPLPVPHNFSSASLQPPNMASSHYWNWSGSSMPTIPTSLDPSLMDFDMMNPNTTKPDSYFQIDPPVMQPLTTTYATSNPMYTTTSTLPHRRTNSGFNSSPASPSLRATAFGAHMRRPNSASYTSNPLDPQYMAQLMAMRQGNGNASYGMR